MFTERVLTVTSDRLIALAGIAKVIGQALNEEYCAGLWQRNLAVDLCWFSLDPRGLKPRPGGYRAPSWSWASLDGRCRLVFFADDKTTDCVLQWVMVELSNGMDRTRLCDFPLTTPLFTCCLGALSVTSMEPLMCFAYCYRRSKGAVPKSGYPACVFRRTCYGRLGSV